MQSRGVGASGSCPLIPRTPRKRHSRNPLKLEGVKRVMQPLSLEERGLNALGGFRGCILLIPQRGYANALGDAG